MGGFKGREPERISQFARWTASEKLDLIAMNEVNGFDTESLAALGEKVGFPHSQLLETGSGYHLAVLSRQPFRVHPTDALPMCHGLLHVEFGVKVVGQEGDLVGPRGFHVMVTHLTPHSVTDRHKEVAAILDHCRALLDDGTPVVLLGDLNALSPEDREVHDHALLRDSVLSQNPGLALKFLDVDGADVDYVTLNTLLGAGFHDPGCGVPASTSVPTEVSTDLNHAAAMRLDYALVSPGVVNLLEPRSAASAAAWTVRTEVTEQISDHVPIRLDLPLQPVVSPVELCADA